MARGLFTRATGSAIQDARSAAEHLFILRDRQAVAGKVLRRIANYEGTRDGRVRLEHGWTYEFEVPGGQDGRVEGCQRTAEPL